MKEIFIKKVELIKEGDAHMAVADTYEIECEPYNGQEYSHKREYKISRGLVEVDGKPAIAYEWIVLYMTKEYPIYFIDRLKEECIKKLNIDPYYDFEEGEKYYRQLQKEKEEREKEKREAEKRIPLFLEWVENFDEIVTKDHIFIWHKFEEIVGDYYSQLNGGREAIEIAENKIGIINLWNDTYCYFNKDKKAPNGVLELKKEFIEEYMPIGAFIGKGGSNIKEQARRNGLKFIKLI